MATNTQSQKPTHNVCVKIAEGGKTSWENVGVAWTGEKGFFIKLAGKQIVDQPLHMFPIEDKSGQ